LDLSLLLLVFSLIFTVVSKLLLLYSTIDKTFRLKMKSFSTVRDTQRGSQTARIQKGHPKRSHINKIPSRKCILEIGMKHSNESSMTVLSDV